eukprot:12931007-Prorocentrum_lima.AAC.1
MQASLAVLHLLGAHLNPCSYFNVRSTAGRLPLQIVGKHRASAPLLGAPPRPHWGEFDAASPASRGPALSGE